MISRLDDILFERYGMSSASLATYRVVFAAYTLLFFVPRHQWLRNVPDAFSYPALGPALVFDGFPPGWTFVLLDVALVVALVGLLFGWRPRATSLTVGGLLVVGNLWRYSLGKIDHDILLVSVPLVLAFCYWGRHPEDDPSSNSTDDPSKTKPPGNTWPLAILALIIALAMFSAALLKLLGGWADPDAYATLYHAKQNAAMGSRDPILWDTISRYASPGWPWKVVDYATLVLEAGFLLAWPWPRKFRLVCATAVLFHVGVYLTMDIAFRAPLIAYLAFFGLSGLRDSAPNWLTAPWVQRTAQLCVGVYAAVLLYGIAVGDQLSVLDSMRSILVPPVFGVAAILAVSFLVQHTRQ